MLYMTCVADPGKRIISDYILKDYIFKEKMCPICQIYDVKTS